MQSDGKGKAANLKGKNGKEGKSEKGEESEKGGEESEKGEESGNVEECEKGEESEEDEEGKMEGGSKGLKCEKVKKGRESGLVENSEKDGDRKTVSTGGRRNKSSPKQNVVKTGKVLRKGMGSKSSHKLPTCKFHNLDKSIQGAQLKTMSQGTYN